MATDTSGNQRVAFEWGNVPMQPNNARTDQQIYRTGELNQSSYQYTPPALGTGDSHIINGIAWDGFPNSEPNAGATLVDGGPLFTWPSSGICYNDPKSPGNRWQDMIEYLRSAGVDPALLKEATFTGGDNKYDWQNGEYDSGIIFWAYIPVTELTYINWSTGTVYTGKDFDGFVINSAYAPGYELGVAGSPENFWFTAFTNDPAKNNTSGWL